MVKIRILYHNGDVELTEAETYDAKEVHALITNPQETHVVIGNVVAHAGTIARVSKVED